MTIVTAVQRTPLALQSMGKPGVTGIRRIIHAAGYSAQGLRAAWQHESAFRQECVLVALLIPAAVWLAETAFDCAILIAAALQILIIELLNSAVEAAVDRVGHEHHALSGQAKDIASAAVALSIGLLVLIWAGYGWSRFAGA